MIKTIFFILQRIYHWFRFARVGIFVIPTSLPKMTLGSSYGGYNIPALLVTENWNCFCLGAGEDITFELELAEQFDASVFIFDPTPRAIQHFDLMQAKNDTFEKSKIYFFPYGAWSSNETLKFYAPQNPEHVSHSILNMQATEEYFMAECLTPTSLMEKSRCKSMDLLKLNIEGAEYEVMQALFLEGIYPTVICITFDELHTQIDGGAAQRLKDLVTSFKLNGYIPIDASGAKVTYLLKDKLP